MFCFLSAPEKRQSYTMPRMDQIRRNITRRTVGGVRAELRSYCTWWSYPSSKLLAVHKGWRRMRWLWKAIQDELARQAAKLSR
jgi:hypothetical protein